MVRHCCSVTSSVLAVAAPCSASSRLQVLVWHPFVLVLLSLPKTLIPWAWRWWLRLSGMARRPQLVPAQTPTRRTSSRTNLVCLDTRARKFLKMGTCSGCVPPAGPIDLFVGVGSTPRCDCFSAFKYCEPRWLAQCGTRVNYHVLCALCLVAYSHTAHVLMETSPVGEHQANGVAESTVHTVGGMLLRHKLAPEPACGRGVASRSCCNPVAGHAFSCDGWQWVATGELRTRGHEASSTDVSCQSLAIACCICRWKKRVAERRSWMPNFYGRVHGLEAGDQRDAHWNEHRCCSSRNRQTLD